MSGQMEDTHNLKAFLDYQLIHPGGLIMKKIKKVAGGIILSVGILLGLLITSLIIWGDLEASVFTNGINGESGLTNLDCPVFITAQETGSVSVVLKNPADKKSDRYVRAFISEGYATLVRETKTKVALPPNGKQKVEWKIYPDDAAYKHVILFRLYVNAKYPYPSMSGNCGILKVDIPWLNGGQILSISSGFALICIFAGVLLLESGEKLENKNIRSAKNAAYFLTGLLVITGLLSYIGFWLFGVLGLAVSLLMVGVIIFRR
jgi:hypothetical protein